MDTHDLCMSGAGEYVVFHRHRGKWWQLWRGTAATHEGAVREAAKRLAPNVLADALVSVIHVGEMTMREYTLNLQVTLAEVQCR